MCRCRRDIQRPAECHFERHVSRKIEIWGATNEFTSKSDPKPNCTAKHAANNRSLNPTPSNADKTESLAALPFEAAAEEMIRCSGSHFDPQVVSAFTSVPLDVWRQIRGLAAEPGLTLEDDTTGRKLCYSALTLSGNQVKMESAAGEIDVR